MVRVSSISPYLCGCVGKEAGLALRSWKESCQRRCHLHRTPDVSVWLAVTLTPRSIRTQDRRGGRAVHGRCNSFSLDLEIYGIGQRHAIPMGQRVPLRQNRRRTTIYRMRQLTARQSNVRDFFHFFYSLNRLCAMATYIIVTLCFASCTAG